MHPCCSLAEEATKTTQVAHHAGGPATCVTWKHTSGATGVAEGGRKMADRQGSGRAAAELLPSGRAQSGTRQVSELGVDAVLYHETVTLRVGELLDDLGNVGIGNGDVGMIQGLLPVRCESC